MINLIQYYSKTEYKFCNQTSFHDVTSHASSGLRENVIATNFVLRHLIPNVWEPNGCQASSLGESYSLMNMASIMVLLVMPWASLSTRKKTVQLDEMTCGVAWS